MGITIHEIEEHKFKQKFRGYDDAEVDEFLDLICEEMAAMQREIAVLQERLSRQSRQIPASPVPAPAAASAPVRPAAPFSIPAVPVQIPAPVSFSPTQPEKAPVKQEEKPVEKPAEKADQSQAAIALMQSAQKIYDQTLSDAKLKAEEIIRKANEEMDERVKNLENEKKQAMEEVEMVRAAAKDYRERFLRLIKDQEYVLNGEKELFE